MRNKGRKPSAQQRTPDRKRPVMREDTTPISRTDAPAPMAAGQKAARSRARRATVLKTLKTGKESFSRER